MRYIFMIIIFTLLLHAHAPSSDTFDQDPRLDQKVSISINGLPFDEALPKISNQVNINFSAASNVANDIVVLFTHELPLKDVMHKIAEHFHFEWERSGTAPNYSYTLYQSAKEVEAERFRRKQAREEYVDNYRKHIPLYVKYTNQSPKFLQQDAIKNLKLAIKESDSTKSKALLDKSELERTFSVLSNRIYIKLLSGLNNNQWMKISKGEGITLSTYPVYGEYPLSSDVCLAMQRWLEGQARASKSHRKETALAPSSHLMLAQYAPPAAPLEGLPVPDFSKVNLSKTKIGIVRLQIGINKMQSWLGCDGRFYDKHGKVINSIWFRNEYSNDSGEYLPFMWGSDELPKLPAGLEEKSEALRKRLYPNEIPENAAIEEPSKYKEPFFSKKIKPFESLPPKVVTAVLTKQTNENREANFIALLKWLHKAIALPDNKYPISWCYGNYLGQISNETNVNIISDGFDAYAAAIQYPLFDGGDAQFLKGGDLRSIVSLISEILGPEVKYADKWLSFRDKYSYELRHHDLPRNKLNKWIWTAENRRSYTLDDLADIASSVEVLQMGNTPTLLNLLIIKNNNSYCNAEDIDNLDQCYMLRFYDSLTSSQKQSLLKGKYLSLNSLNTVQKIAFNRILLTIADESPFNIILNKSEPNNSEKIHLTISSAKAFYKTLYDNGQLLSREPITADLVEFANKVVHSLPQKAKTKGNVEELYDPNAILQTYNFDLYSAHAQKQTVTVKVYKDVPKIK